MMTVTTSSATLRNLNTAVVEYALDYEMSEDFVVEDIIDDFLWGRIPDGFVFNRHWWEYGA